MNLTVSIIAFVTLCLIDLSLGYRINSKIYDKDPANTEQNSISNRQRYEQSFNYVKTSIPIQIFRCMQQTNLLKCMKMFILERMERTRSYTNSGNLTADFLDQILTNQDLTHSDNFEKSYIDLDDSDLNQRLLDSFQKFFRGREIKLHFIPGMIVKVVPNAENTIKLSVKRGSREIVEGRKRNRPAEYLLQFGVPALMMPAILMGTVLPFVLPALKIATIASTLINNGALVAAVMYAAKNAATQSHENKAVYYNPGYHREMHRGDNM